MNRPHDDRSDDDLWYAMTAHDDPTTDEMARAEAALQEMPAVEPLRSAVVDDLVARAVGDEVAKATAVRRAATRRRILVAAGAMVMLAAVAFFVRVLWVEKRDSHRTMDYQMAVLLTIEPGHDDEERLSALFFITAKCQGVAAALSQIAIDANEQVANRASEIRGRAIAILDGGSQAPSLAELTSPDIDGALDVATQTNAMREARLLALDDMDRFLIVGVKATVACRLTIAEAADTRTNLAAKLRRWLLQ